MRATRIRPYGSAAPRESVQRWRRRRSLGHRHHLGNAANPLLSPLSTRIAASRTTRFRGRPLMA